MSAFAEVEFSLCYERGCYRYGPTCSHYQGFQDPGREPDERELTCFHEAAHAVVAQELGWTVRKLVVEGYGHNAGGYIVGSRRDPQDVRDVRRDLIVALAGSIGARLARQDPNPTAHPDAALYLEEHSTRPGMGMSVSEDAARAFVRRGETRSKAETWIAEALPDAAEDARAMIEAHWTDVVYYAHRLADKGKIDYSHVLDKAREGDELHVG
jgi:hypothetical protein